jgi:hypothetical protein
LNSFKREDLSWFHNGLKSSLEFEMPLVGLGLY